MYTNNESDAWVWVTTYGLAGDPTSFKGFLSLYAQQGQMIASGQIKGSIQGAWCVKPHSFDKHGVTALIYDVRSDVTKANCAHPVMLDRTMRFAGIDMPGKAQQEAKPGIMHISGQDGKYTVNEAAGAAL